MLMPPAGPDRPAHAAFGIKLAAYRFDRYRTTEKPEKKPSVKTRRRSRSPTRRPPPRRYKTPLRRSPTPSATPATWSPSRPTSSIPEEYARRVQELDQARPRGRGAGREGDEEARHGLAARRRPGQRAREPAGGHPVEGRQGRQAPRRSPSSARASCFDTGGISLKPADGMEEMITDMAGSAAVVGAMYALAARKAKVNAVGILGLVENMPDAQRPAARRRRDLDVRPDHRGDQHRRRGPPRAGRRGLVLPGPLQAEVHGRPRHADRRDRGLARQGPRRPLLQRRDAGGQSDGGLEGHRRRAVAHAAARPVRQADREPSRRHEERRPAPGRLDHRGAVHQEVHQRPRLGAHRHGLHRLEAELAPWRPSRAARAASACGCSTGCASDYEG